MEPGSYNPEGASKNPLVDGRTKCECSTSIVNSSAATVLGRSQQILELLECSDTGKGDSRMQRYWDGNEFEKDQEKNISIV
ncbi:hypothetical protein BUALT_Bualt01G0080100 [Buddleja alternifolia]|uniref:Uncharacterized protein n=1 Tax=Buddleja alternifolia TaxID=168488 RepID=A0AAV6YDW5_9LAMI|nr:hypothetical protein BUALT_Bualt01G0080100 [Buddleja alternifolia]